MEKVKLDGAWEYIESDMVHPIQNAFLGSGKKVHLPHDYVLDKERKLEYSTDRHEGFTPGASLYYKKKFMVRSEAEGKSFILEFEGITGIAHVWVNQQMVAKHINGYTSFCTDITDVIRIGEENQIIVFVENRHKPASRWYTGTGIYRHVWLHIGENMHVKPWMLHVETKKIDSDQAHLDIRTTIVNQSDKTEQAVVQYEILDEEQTIVYTHSEACELFLGENQVSHLATVSPFHYWNVDHPYLYTVRLGIGSSLGNMDFTEVKTGIRTIQFDSQAGFLLNGQPMKLKGGCIHHDHGILGTASHDDAELRKAKLLKEAGFNAVRLAHNPYSPSFLDSCDQVGLLVIEEAFDTWVLGKTSFDYNIFFEKHWEDDLTAMIQRDFNHPSIIMWSTGNEVEERDGSANGYEWSRRLAEKVKSLDPRRAVTASACSVLAENEGAQVVGEGNLALNMLESRVDSDDDVWGNVTEAFLEPLDTAGYNYKVGRYAYDAKRFPDRVIYGAETFPSTLFENWNETLKNPNVIGDFVWTAIDYLGEAGVGYIIHANAATDDGLPLTAFTGDLDICGNKRPQSYYRDAVWGNSNKPFLAVLPPSLYSEQLSYTKWGWRPVEHNYTFNGQEGQKTAVEIYSNADEIELFVNGVSQGKKSTGYQSEFKAEFEIIYQPGTIEAVAYKDEMEIGRDCLETAGVATELILKPDKAVLEANGEDLCYIQVTAVDENGREVFNEERKIRVSVEGVGELLAFGSGNPKPKQLYTDSENYLYEGKALAVIRSTLDHGKCTLNVGIEGCDMQSITIDLAGNDIDENKFVQVILTEQNQVNYWEQSLEALLADEKTQSIIKKYFAEILNHPMFNTVKSMSLNQIKQYTGELIPKDAFENMDER